ncbi:MULTISPECIES: hypothetical protein [Enterobacter]|uniref:hypothetical protein n=1 Tax=Enterobacter TaxID=547 RepID=UPI000DF03E0F|nr:MULTISPECIES: hypothetical protein [Enterobacter cloacae complex]AXC33137.1 hypothetical protein [Aeromonas phage AsXd-1]HEA7464774.1 hypothetical protein [Escherichia coli]MBW7715417.1 hypothetical protein [Enterobacter kobei]MBW7720732.1 hypothetical protein [Enterobacter kobei]BCP71411.1 hypothetical protein R1N_35980 [Enterobacter asburiae]
MANKPEIVHHEGNIWYPFQVNFTDVDGRPFSFIIHAVSPEHASYVVQEIRETATLGDQLVSITK